MEELMNLVESYNGVAMTTSLKIAEVFGKEHKHVLDSIRKLVAENSAAKFFNETTYVNRGKEYLMYEIDRDGFSLLAMGFAGEKALQWKLKYIAAFNAMEEKLKQSDILTEEERLKLRLFSKNPVEVSAAYNRLTEIEIEKATLTLKQEITQQQETIAMQDNTITEQNKEIKTMKPKAKYCDLVLNSPDKISATVIAKDYGWSVTKFNNFLHEKGIQYKIGKNSPWLLYQKYADKGYTKSGTNPYKDRTGKDHSKIWTYWTQKGRLFIYKVMKDAGYLPLIEQPKEN